MNSEHLSTYMVRAVPTYHGTGGTYLGTMVQAVPTYYATGGAYLLWYSWSLLTMLQVHEWRTSLLTMVQVAPTYYAQLVLTYYGTGGPLTMLQLVLAFYATGGAIEAVYMLPRTALIDAQVSFAKARTQRIQHTWSAIPKKLRLQQDQNLLARTVHSQLLCHFNWTAQQLPLLELDMSNPVEPFRRVP